MNRTIALSRRYGQPQRRATSWTNSRKHLVLATLIMMALALIYLWPALIAGKILSANSVLFLFAPWHSIAPPNFESTWNPVLSDIPTEIYPWNFFAREMIRSGIFPTWNPDAFAGTPFYANAQTGILSPFNLPLWVLPLNYGIALSAWLKLWLGGLGSYLLARELKVGFVPGILAGVSFLLCAMNVVSLTHEAQPAVAAMMPWALLLGERIAQRRRWSDAFAMVAVSTVAITAGHPETAVQMFAGTMLYLAVRLLTLSDTSWRQRVRSLALGAGGVLGGALLSAVVLLPVLSVALGTPGAAAREGGAFTLPLSAAKTVLFPSWWEWRNLPLPGPANYNDRTFYVGTAALLLAGMALFSRARYRDKLALILLAAVGLGAAFGAPVIHWIVAHVPPLSNTNGPYMLLWFEIAVPVLAAFGLQSLLDSPRRQRAAWICVSSAVVVALIAVAAVNPSLHELRTTLNHLRTGRSYSDPKIVSLTSVGWMLIFVSLLALVLVILRRSRRRHWSAMAIVLLAAADLLHFADGYEPMLPLAQSTPRATPAVTYLKEHAGNQRVVGIASTLLDDYGMVYGLRDARGYDPPQPSYRYLRLWQLANPRQIATEPLEIPALSSIGVKVMSVLGVRYVVDNPADPPITSLKDAVVYRGNDAIIYLNSSSVPQAFVARAVMKVSGEGNVLRAISSKTFDPRTDAVLEQGEPGVANVDFGSEVGSATVTHMHNTNVTMRADLRRAGLVILDEALTAGWDVTVDGHSRPAIRVDDVMRGVSVPAGSHLIAWHYTVPGLRVGLILSLATSLSLFGGVGFIVWGRRRRLRARKELL